MDYPKYIRLRQAINNKIPDQSPEESNGSEPSDIRNMEAARTAKEEALRRISGEGNIDITKESEPGSENPMLAPDDLIGPGEIKALGGAALKGVPMAAGVLGQSLRGSRPLAALGLKAGDTFRKALGHIMENEGVALGSTAIEQSGKTGEKFLADKADELASKGIETISSPKSQLLAEHGIDAGYVPNKKQLLLPNDIKDENLMAGLVTHEGKHVDEILNKLINPKDVVNYTDITPDKLAEIQKIFPDVTDYPSLRQRILELYDQGRYVKGAMGQVVRKAQHFADPNIKNLEADVPLKYLYEHSKDSINPGEIDLLNSVNPRIINPIESKKAAIELFKKKK